MLSRSVVHAARAGGARSAWAGASWEWWAGQRMWNWGHLGSLRQLQPDVA